jgi:hypothetical protein
LLLSELGDELAKDSSFPSFVERVSALLAQEPRISARLDEVLRELAHVS